MSDSLLGLGAVVLLIAANAFFVAGEFALVAVDRTRVEQLADAGNRRGRMALSSLRRLSFQLSGAQLGITATSLVLGFIAESAVGDLIEPAIDAIPGLSSDAADAASVAVALTLATGVQMVLGELVPKNVAIARPLRSTLWIVPALRAYSIVASPVIRLLNSSADWTVRRLGIEPREEIEAVRTLEELELLIQSSGEEGTLAAEEQELLTRSIRFGDKTAADALVPRTSITALDRADTVTDLIRLARETGYSRFPVVGRDLDDIAGVVHVKSAYQVPVEDRSATSVERLMGDPLIVPETRPLDDILLEMRARRRQLAVVIDEYGGTAGIVTLEDLLEEIVGDIRDEYDPVTSQLTIPRQAGTYVLEGSLHRDEVRELVGLQLPDGPFDTIAGHLLVLFDRIPGVGDRVTWEGWDFEVLEMDRLRIALVRVTAPPLVDGGVAGGVASGGDGTGPLDRPLEGGGR